MRALAKLSLFMLKIFFVWIGMYIKLYYTYLYGCISKCQFSPSCLLFCIHVGVLHLKWRHFQAPIDCVHPITSSYPIGFSRVNYISDIAPCMPITALDFSQNYITFKDCAPNTSLTQPQTRTKEAYIPSHTHVHSPINKMAFWILTTSGFRI